MKTLTLLTIITIAFASCAGSNDKPIEYNPDNDYVSVPELELGSDEWKLNEIEQIRNDSATLRDVDYIKIAEKANSNMSDAIDFLSSNSPSWHGFREAYADFYTKDKRASVPIDYIIKTSRSKLNQVLPLYRKAFANNLANALWEKDIYVTSSGSLNTVLNLTGGIFAANANISDMQKMLNEDVRHFGFKQVRYRWYKGAEEYTSYTIN